MCGYRRLLLKSLIMTITSFMTRFCLGCEYDKFKNLKFCEYQVFRRLKSPFCLRPKNTDCHIVDISAQQDII